MRDNYCDAVNNRAFCSYDGGDCCQSTVKTKKVSGGTLPGLLLAGSPLPKPWRDYAQLGSTFFSSSSSCASISFPHVALCPHCAYWLSARPLSRFSASL